MISYYEIAKTAYCMEGNQWDCRCCPLCKYLETHNFDASKCRKYLIIGLVNEIDLLNKKIPEKKRII